MADTPTPTGRQTAHREAVLRTLGAAPGFVSAHQVHQSLRLAGTPAGLATVYRQLRALVACGAVDTVSGPHGELFGVSPAGDEHRHYLVCENCGRAVPVEPDESWIRATAGRHGYTVTRHVLEVFGLCPDCTAAQVEVRGSAEEARADVHADAGPGSRRRARSTTSST